MKKTIPMILLQIGKNAVCFSTIIALALLFCLSSCSVKKRVYMPGYNVNWKESKQNAIKQELADNDNDKKEEQDNSLPTEIYTSDNTVTASTNNSIIFTVPNKISLLKTIIQLKKKINSIKILDECDVIILRNGNEIKAKVIEVSQTEIKYKKCDRKEGPLYTIYKNDVFMVKYSDGNKDVFKIKKNTEAIPKQSQDQYKETGKTDDVKELSISEKCLKGTQDGKMHTSEWYWGGVLLGLIGVILAAAIRPKVPFNKLSNDPAYRSCYEREAKKKNALAALWGWLVFILIFFIIMSVAMV